MTGRAAGRLLAIPLVFLVAGPPAGLAALIGIVLGLSHWDLGPPPGFAADLLRGFHLCWVFGGAQAVLVGLAAALAARGDGRLRALPALLAALAIGVLLPLVLQVILGGDDGAGVGEVAIFALVHLAGAVAGLAACRAVGRSGTGRP